MICSRRVTTPPAGGKSASKWSSPLAGHPRLSARCSKFASRNSNSPSRGQTQTRAGGPRQICLSARLSGTFPRAYVPGRRAERQPSSAWSDLSGRTKERTTERKKDGMECEHKQRKNQRACGHGLADWRASASLSFLFF